MEDKGQVEGRNAVSELIDSGKDINKIFVQSGERHGKINLIINKAKSNGIVVVETSKKTLDEMSETNNHQGIIAIVPPFEYVEVEDILEFAKEKNEDTFILILDGIEDVHNLGSIIRTAEAAGVHGIIIPKRRAAAVNSTVIKTSAGAVEHMKIARVNNINEMIEYLKTQGVWICGTDMETNTEHWIQDYNMPVAIVIGSEGRGISRLTKEKCDFIVKIPMKGKINSLNASVSAAIVTYEVLRNRKGVK